MINNFAARLSVPKGRKRKNGTLYIASPGQMLRFAEEQSCRCALN